MFDSAAFPLSMAETGALDAPRSAPSLTVLESPRNEAFGLVRNCRGAQNGLVDNHPQKSTEGIPYVQTKPI